MTCNSMILRSSIIASFALLALHACERGAQPGGAEDDTTGAAMGSAGTGAGMRARDDSEAGGTERGRASADQAGVEIERTSGRDMPLGGGGAAGRTGAGGRGGAGGTASRP
jgi:hypothetical protein